MSLGHGRRTPWSHAHPKFTNVALCPKSKHSYGAKAAALKILPQVRLGQAVSTTALRLYRVGKKKALRPDDRKRGAEPAKLWQKDSLSAGQEHGKPSPRAKTRIEAMRLMV